MYNTKQLKAIMDFIAVNRDSYITVNQIEEDMKQQDIKIGLTTIYRHLERLQSQGLINKIKVEGINGACYKFNDIERDSVNDKNYFGLKCDKCGKMIKVDCSHLSGLYSHISRDHEFTINPNKTVFYGVCSECEKK